MLLKADRIKGPKLRFELPNRPEVILAQMAQSNTQVILVMGPPGSTGPSGGTAETIEYQVTNAGQQNIVLNRIATAGLLFLNGLMQSPSYYTLSGTNLTVPTNMGCVPGDVINFTY